MRVVKEDYISEYIHLFLTTSKIGGLLFDQKEMRTAQPKLSDKDIYDFPIPKLKTEKQKKISELIEESFRLKKESENLLETAKRAVEVAIEETEESAMEFINSEIK
jgi:restriction endonuclease S subunit